MAQNNDNERTVIVTSDAERKTRFAWMRELAFVVAIVGGAWVIADAIADVRVAIADVRVEVAQLAGEVAELAAKVEHNGVLIERNAEAIARNAEAIARNAEAIGELKESMASLAGAIRRTHPRAPGAGQPLRALRQVRISP